MKNKGISAVVATVLIILITVAAVTVIWTAIMPMIKDNLDFSSLEGRVSVVTSSGYTYYDVENKLASVHVKRESDEGVMDRINIIFSVDGDSFVSSVVAPAPGNKKVYVFDVSSIGEPDSVSVAPIFAVGNKEKIGDVTSNIVIGEGSVKSVGFVYEAETDYFSDLTDGLVGWWKFEGDASDSIGGYDGTANGGVDLNYVDAERGIVGKFDGVNDYVNLSSNIIRGNTGSISFWTNVYSRNGNVRVFSTDHSLGGASEMRTYFTGTSFLLYVTNGLAGFSTPIPYLLLEWDLFTFTWSYDGADTILKGYKNGEFVSELLFSGEIPAPDNGADFGRWGGSNYFEGLIDDFMIYDRVISDDEVLIIYESQKV